MKDARGVLITPTARGMRPIDDPWPVSFAARWLRSQRIEDGLVHAFSPTVEKLRVTRTSPEGVENTEDVTYRGWAAFCAPGLSHRHLPGEACVVEYEPITCVTCASKI